MIETILVYKLTHLSLEDIWNMINLEHIDITRTFFYQQAQQKGMEKGKQQSCVTAFIKQTLWSINRTSTTKNRITLVR